MTEIFKNRKAIWEGLKNRVFKQEHIEAIYNERITICKGCSLYDITDSGCHVSGTQPCCNLNLGGCGCSLSLKLRALSEHCPKDKWKAVTDKQEEDMINQQILNDKLNGTKS